MEIKQTDESSLDFEPTTDDESDLAGLFFDQFTRLQPEMPMGDRADMAMAAVVVVKKWAHNLELTSESSKVVQLDP